MEGEVFDDLRQFIEGAKKITEWREIKGASWDLEISTLIEATAELIPQPPMLLFDEIAGYPRGFRVWVFHMLLTGEWHWPSDCRTKKASWSWCGWLRARSVPLSRSRQKRSLARRSWTTR